ncbi:MAG: RNA polymerase sigma factor [Bacteroidales bacterium]|nr:RNA polymerase sigma factor [Bacteroidales bacterium]
MESIIEGCRKGDGVMQKALYDRFSGKFYVLCCRYMSNNALAQEVLSDGFLRVFEQIGNYRGEGSFEGWMRTIFVRCAMKKYRQEQYRQEVCTDDDVELPGTNGNYDTQMDLRDALMAAMHRLPDIERQAFNLVAVEGYKLEEAADLIEENISTLKSRYYKALQKMRSMMKNYLEDK